MKRQPAVASVYTFHSTCEFNSAASTHCRLHSNMHQAPPDLVVPRSYTDLPTKDIKVSHYPADSPIATPVIVVTLNRPKARNAFTIRMMRDFELCYPLFDVDERVKCIVLTGNPAGKAFCAGADLDIGFSGAIGTDAGGKIRVQDSRDT